MTFPEITALSRHLDETDPADRAEHGHNVARLRELCAFVQEKTDPEVAACLEATARLIEAISGPSDRLDRRIIHEIACRLLGTVEQALRDLVDPTVGRTIEKPPIQTRTDKRPPLDLKLAHPKAFGGGAPAHARPTPPPAAPRPAPQQEAHRPLTGQQSAPRPAAPRPAPPQQQQTPAQQQPAAPQPPAMQPPAMHPLPTGASTDAPPGPSAYEPKGNPALPKINNMVFGELMIELGWSTREQVAKALDMHLQVGIPVGECLLVQGSATPERILEALKIQERMRSMSGDSEQLSPAAAAAPQAPGLAASDASILVTKQIFFGEVLLGMGMITKDQLEQAMRVHHFENVRVGQALVDMGALSEQDLQRGLEIQRSLLFAAGLPVDQANQPRHSRRR